MMINNKPQCIVFSKDRPMQLQAYLDSLFWYTDITPEDTYVIVDQLKWYTYLQNQDVNFVCEAYFDSSFIHTLMHAVESCDTSRPILFGCDDVVFTNFVNITSLYSCIEDDDTVAGLSLRLGRNIYPRPENHQFTRLTPFLQKWHYKNYLGCRHWGWPFELMASVYPRELVYKIIESEPDKIRNPNYLEGVGVEYMARQNTTQSQLACLCFDSCVVGMDVNRVQDTHPNRTNGTEQQDVDYLKTQFSLGKRLNWKKLFGVRTNDVFVGDRYWELI
ncbi:MAG: hypothetical protein WC942_01790 [Clostridia bacterium]|jgi:hypothetical protein